MKRATGIFLVLWVCLSWCSGEITTEPVLIQVVVTNETGGLSPAADAEVTLTIYRDNKVLEQRTGRSDRQGVCPFEQVPTGRAMAVVASAKNQDMMFSSRAISLEHAHEPMYQLDISVYDVSTDTSVLSIGTHHFVLQLEPQGVFVDEYIQIVNDSDRAVISDQKTPDGKPVVLELFLPMGFKDVSYSKYFVEHAIVTTDRGFIDTMAVPPGKHDAVFSYPLKSDSGTLQVVKKVSLPTKDFRVFTQLRGASLDGLSTPLGQMTLSNGSSADYYPSASLQAGDEVSFKITGLSVAQDQDDLWVMFGAIFGVVTLVGIIRLFARKAAAS
jgi:hypothetical protein